MDKYKNLWALSYTSAVIGWDLETYMPHLGATARGEAMGRLSTIRQRLFLDKDFVSLIHKAEKEKNLNDAEQGVIRILLHNLKFYEKLPPKFLEDFSRLTSESSIIWRDAKEKNDFKSFEKSLSKIFDMNRESAEYLGHKDSPYDALLDSYEEGLSSNMVEPFFEEIRAPLKELLNKIIKSDVYQNQEEGVQSLQNAKYDREKMIKLNDKILKFLWKDYGQNFRLDTSAHPFTTSFSKLDTRITTWYHERDFGRSLLATIHEFGHALYDLQCDTEFEATPVSGGSSLVIHESQSRFWENFVGRSEEFIKYFKKDFDDLFISKQFNSPTVQQYYSYFNKVRPSLLRVEADEVTYHFHIMLRYEIEKGIIEKKLKVKDLPEIWNEKMKEYLGVSPSGDSEGVLQDIHWSMGNVGYFPTYSMGTFLGAQWEQKLGVGNSMLNIGKIEGWLKEHIHQYGSTYTLQDLLAKNKMHFDPQVNIKYLEAKYSEIYNS